MNMTKAVLLAKARQALKKANSLRGPEASSWRHAAQAIADYANGLAP